MQQDAPHQKKKVVATTNKLYEQIYSISFHILIDYMFS
jgi:hypothetical protein